MPDTNSPDSRLVQLSDWLSASTSPKLQTASMRAASSDASFRRYFRVDGDDGNTYIAMDAPPPQESVERFVKLAGRFAETGVAVPAILQQDRDRGFLLVSDFGNTDYLRQLNRDTAHKLYLDAIDAIVQIQVRGNAEGLPEYDRAFLLREMNLFPEWFIGKHLGLEMSNEQNEKLQKVFDAILATVLAQPQVLTHRDFHCRNLMVLEKNNPGILDFQDAVLGPITYDLASLLRDAYIEWDEEIVLDWAIRYWERARRAGLPLNNDVDAFYRDFEFTGLQRHLKILGLFARLYHRDGKEGYLKDMPLVMSYVRKVANRYTVLAPLARMLDELENKAPQFGYTF
jgi:aminoglycoside/choline kinase family phosphotransferase